jgi:mono/diheme cytochrome c family protein
VPPLTADEQKRFAAGREIYSNVCAGCHQADGRGKEKMAPSLIGSRYVVGNAAVTARILLAGKEGAGGMMPPFAASLTDEQIAAVITYLRREWGHTASPVERADVREVRGLTASHKGPWSDEELSRYTGGLRGARGNP